MSQNFIEQMICQGLDKSMETLKELHQKQNRVEVINLTGDTLPKYQTKGSNAVDLHARTYNGTEMLAPIDLALNEVVMFGTGIKVNMPEGMCGLVLSRSGTGKKGYNLAQSIGLIDNDYHGEIMLPIKNTSDDILTVKPNMRIAQLLFIQAPQVLFKEVDSFDVTTERDEGGFGSTGE